MKGILMKTGIALVAIAAGLAGFAAVSCGDSNHEIKVETAAKTETSSPAWQGNIHWNTDWNEAMAAAKTAGKPVYIHFTTDWCTWCRKMEQETYSDPEVQKRFQNWIVLQINAEDRKKTGTLYYDSADRTRNNMFGPGDSLEKHDLTYPELFQFSGGSGYPTLEFVDGSGKFIYAVSTYLPKEQFIHWLDYFGGKMYERNINLGEYLKSKS